MCMMLFLFMNLLGYLSEMSMGYIHTPPKVLFMELSPCKFEFQQVSCCYSLNSVLRELFEGRNRIL